ncbi:putative oxidoreductase (fatty acid repression mutant protein) [Psychrobacter sp. PL15]|jgi:predicted oxidoreductase (fatty acid repression mutant protein)|uniref:nitroreductase family protein n=1 Tax=unclassified Psychrobacter TaxID=196806 RepID=UPI001AE5DC81|nr:nitroreductase family protein [Psychrobacter sp. PL15]MEC5209017.1 putative oxidoreductase (fatty acid repression mutant protein) [Psychrobacter sp. PL15]
MTKASLVTLQQAFEERRTIYALGNDLPVDPRAIVDIAERVILQTPSCFNSQSSRLIVLFGEHHQQLWDITEANLRQTVGDGDFSSSKQKIDGFRAGAGTVLFFEDREVVTSLQDKFALYADKFPLWAHQTSAMHQYAMWTELSTLEVGASLQHYNPLIDDDVATAFSVPKNWDLIAQMPFGNILEPAGEKSYQPLNERMKVFGLVD